MHVFDVAMKMELDGKAYYEKLAGQTDLPGLKTIFKDMARDEQKHYDAFKAMKEKKSLPQLSAGATLASARNVFEAMSLPEVALKDVEDTLAAYKHAMDVEDESRKFYEKAAGEESDPQVREALLKIAAEEKQHYDILDNVYQFINAPNQYLSGAEISNLDE